MRRKEGREEKRKGRGKGGREEEGREGGRGRGRKEGGRVERKAQQHTTSQRTPPTHQIFIVVHIVEK